MDKVINNRRQKRKRTNFNIIRNKLNIALIKNGINKINIPTMKNKHSTSESLSVRKNAVKSKRILRSSDSKKKLNAMEDYNFQNKHQENTHSKFDDIVCNTPYSNGTDHGDTNIKFLPHKYSSTETERNKKLMQIISSYLVDDDAEINILKNNSPLRQNSNKNSHTSTSHNINSTQKYENDKRKNFGCMPIAVLTPTFSLDNNISLCSEVEGDESPIYTYYPHRLNQ